MMRLVQAGTGAARDLVIAYHLNAKADQDLRTALGPGPCIVNETVPQADIGIYSAFAPDGIASVGDVLAWATTETGEAFARARLILVGYSAGYIAVRTQLFSGEDPDAIVVADGIQTPRPGERDAVASWIAYIDKAKRGERVFVASHSIQGATKLLSTWETLQLITGFSLLQTGTLTDPAVTAEGKLVVLSYMGNDHQAQGYVVLPRLLGIAMALLSSGSGGIRLRWLKVLGLFGMLALAAGIGILLARRS